VCPVKIDIPELLLHLRAEIADGASDSTKKAGKFSERLAFRLCRFLWSGQAKYRFGMKTGRFFQKLFVRRGKIGQVGKVASVFVPPLGSWTDRRDAPPLAPKSFREQWRDGLKDQ
jgi:L-lactate dehydrogenase complex protein LldF